MVERPIKKSERQAKIESGEISAPEPTSERPAVRAEKPSVGKGGGGKGKGRDKRDRDDDNKPPANMALMRGPKPVMAKPVVEEPPVEADAADETTADAEETPAEG